MTLHACVAGIDGSGKTTVSVAVPRLVCAERGLVTGSAGDAFATYRRGADGVVVEARDGLPVSAPIAAWSKRAAKALVDHRRLYPPFKLAQMAFQDSAAWRMGRRQGCALVVSDGNLLLNAAGRGANYRRPASAGEGGREAPGPEDVAALFRYLVEGIDLPTTSRRRLPPLRAASGLLRALRSFGLRPAWLPDVVIFLDVPPDVALARVVARGGKVDAHENLADLAQARDAYRRTLDAFERFRGPGSVHVLEAGRLTTNEVVRAAADALGRHLR